MRNERQVEQHRVFPDIPRTELSATQHLRKEKPRIDGELDNGEPEYASRDLIFRMNDEKNAERRLRDGDQQGDCDELYIPVIHPLLRSPEAESRRSPDHDEHRSHMHGRQREQPVPEIPEQKIHDGPDADQRKAKPLHRGGILSPPVIELNKPLNIHPAKQIQRNNDRHDAEPRSEHAEQPILRRRQKPRKYGRSDYRNPLLHKGTDQEPERGLELGGEGIIPIYYYH